MEKEPSETLQLILFEQDSIEMAVVYITRLFQTGNAYKIYLVRYGHGLHHRGMNEINIQ
jgi:hypothetical protein